MKRRINYFYILCYGVFFYIVFLHIVAYYSILFYVQNNDVILWNAHRF